MSQRINTLQQAIKQQPQDPALYYELGSHYLVQSDFALSLATLKQALIFAPNHPQILMQMGNAASGLNDETQAQDYFLASLKQDPNQADVHFNLANSLRKLGDLTRAIEHFKRAIQLNPKDADYFNNMGNALRELGQLPEAISAYQQALLIQPEMTHALVHWVHQKQHIADWQGLEAAIEKVRTHLDKPAVKIPPFAFLAMPSTTPQEQALCATQWANAHYQQIQPLPALPARTNRRIRVAYVSSDFRVHPLAYLVTEVLQAHNREQFEVFAYSQTPTEDSLEQTAIRNACDHWIEIHQLSDLEVALHMHQHAMDIVVDLSGYTQNSRSGIIAHQPARKSINWLGFAGTMGQLHGKALFDYIIVDAWVNVDGIAEKPITLPCYQANNAQRPLADAGTRKTHCLPEDAFVFCCFNQSFKLTQAVFDSWLTILKQVPNSVLWLLESNVWASQNLKAYATKHGVEANRLIFAPRVPIAQHIARHVHADLVLDTLPYNAHTTASDALWMGIPIITCTLALDSNKLASIQASLDKHKQALFDPVGFSRRLEQAYIEILSTSECV